MNETKMMLMEPVETPTHILTEAKERAIALKNVVQQAGLAKKIAQKEYLQVEAWQTIARFYGVVAYAGDVQVVDMDGLSGVRAKATVVKISTGEIVGGAEAFVMNDELSWKDRPFYARASMAQTRAISKSLRMMFSWVAVLAGYAPTPAEEMPTEETQIKMPASKPTITTAQQKRIFAIAAAHKISHQEIKDYLGAQGIEHTKDIPKDQYTAICDWMLTQHISEGDDHEIV